MRYWGRGELYCIPCEQPSYFYNLPITTTTRTPPPHPPPHWNTDSANVSDGCTRSISSSLIITSTFQMEKRKRKTLNCRCCCCRSTGSQGTGMTWIRQLPLAVDYNHGVLWRVFLQNSAWSSFGSRHHCLTVNLLRALQCYHWRPWLMYGTVLSTWTSQLSIRSFPPAQTREQRLIK